MPDRPDIPEESGLRDEDRDWLLAALLKNEYVMDELAGRYEGRMPFDESYADEEAEASAARRKGRRQAESDLRSFFAADFLRNQGAEEERERLKAQFVANAKRCRDVAKEDSPEVSHALRIAAETWDRAVAALTPAPSEPEEGQ
jgi:hypothetical protein